MEQGEVEKLIIDQCLREGIPLPDKIANAPTLLPGLELFFVAFLELTDDRKSGMSIGRIPWSVIRMWAKEHDLDEDQTEELHFQISRMDFKYIEYHNSKKG